MPLSTFLHKNFGVHLYTFCLWKHRLLRLSKVVVPIYAPNTRVWDLPVHSISLILVLLVFLMSSFWWIPRGVLLVLILIPWWLTSEKPLPMFTTHLDVPMFMIKTLKLNLCLVLNLRGKAFNPFPLSMILSVGFL